MIGAVWTCRDSLILDCIPLSANSTEPECFVEGLSVVDACKPASGPASTLQDIIKSGKGVDGDDGSLCSLTPTTDKVIIRAMLVIVSLLWVHIRHLQLIRNTRH